MNEKLKNYTFKMIDELKAVCHSQGLSNVGDEFKIITQMFLYKFINDNLVFYSNKRMKTSKTQQIENKNIHV